MVFEVHLNEKSLQLVFTQSFLLGIYDRKMFSSFVIFMQQDVQRKY
jgi:hypothetical protein